MFFKHRLKNKYDGILRDAEAEAEVIKKNKLLEVKEKFLNKKADLEKKWPNVTKDTAGRKQAETT